MRKVKITIVDLETETPIMQEQEWLLIDLNYDQPCEFIYSAQAGHAPIGKMQTTATLKLVAKKHIPEEIF